jgi:hypothetical protein
MKTLPIDRSLHSSGSIQALPTNLTEKQETVLAEVGLSL